MITLSLFLLEAKGDLSNTHCENLVGLLEVKPIKVRIAHVPFCVHTRQYSVFRSSSELSFKYFYQGTALVASAPGKKLYAKILDSSASLVLKVTVFPVTSVFWGKKIIDFQFVSAFPYWNNGNYFHVWSWNWKSLQNFLLLYISTFHCVQIYILWNLLNLAL